MHKAGKASLSVYSSKENSKPKQWWNCDCTNATNRNRFWFNLGHSLGKPREGAL